jgi:alpha-ketoglutarate-dependent taurine dioxygenase
VLSRLPEEVVARFSERKVMYVRNYGEGVDMPWQEVFQTDDREVVNHYLRKTGTTYEWLGKNRLRTRSVRQALATHPVTGQTVWFNHAHMFHASNLPDEVRHALLDEFAEDELPRNAFYGDGQPLEEEVLALIRSLYRGASLRFDWQRSDIMVLDNFLVTHAREPFEGPRSICVAMSELYTHPDYR